MAQVELKKLGKSYGSISAVRDVSLMIGEGEFIVLLGPSGCGKSTTLRMIAGLEDISSGELRIGDKVMNEMDPKNRGVAMVFQNYALYPHKTVFDNMGMALKLLRMPKDEIRRQVEQVAEMLGLTEYLDRKPGALSGGQRQRVAIGRAIVRTPEVFLFDEPLSNLDAKLRVKMRMELQQLHRRLGVTSIYVTHDQVEAMTMADRIVIMDAGEVVQVGTPREVYDTPVNLFVAGFIGSPAMNFIELKRTGTEEWRAGDGRFCLQKLPFNAVDKLDRVTVGIRPEHLEVLASNAVAQDDWTFDADVALSELLGADALLKLSVEGVEMLSRVGGIEHPEIGDRLRVRFPKMQLHAFDSATGNALTRCA